MDTLDIAGIQEWKREHWQQRQWKKTLSLQAPVKELEWFSTQLWDTMPLVESALIEAVQIFTPSRTTNELFKEFGITALVGGTSGYVSDNENQIRRLLVALIYDGHDVTLLPQPAKWYLVADHHADLTIFSSKPGWIAELKQEMLKRKINETNYYTHDPPR